jgi:hypothetical protein
VVVFTPQIKNKYLANPTPNSYHSDNKILAPTAQLYAHFFGLWLFLRHNVQIYFACKTWQIVLARPGKMTTFWSRKNPNKSGFVKCFYFGMK